ncbi:hypothetical protein VE04_08571 [Pseudogymnoascus sp. 24MN13]|nr:hypothetical protein VE04_08571 [Pseudogymnoascus sp. 24MN13]
MLILLERESASTEAARFRFGRVERKLSAVSERVSAIDEAAALTADAVVSMSATAVATGSRLAIMLLSPVLLLPVLFLATDLLSCYGSFFLPPALLLPALFFTNICNRSLLKDPAGYGARY